MRELGFSRVWRRRNWGSEIRAHHCLETDLNRTTDLTGTRTKIRPRKKSLPPINSADAEHSFLDLRLVLIFLDLRLVLIVSAQLAAALYSNKMKWQYACFLLYTLSFFSFCLYLNYVKSIKTHLEFFQKNLLIKNSI